MGWFEAGATLTLQFRDTMRNRPPPPPPRCLAHLRPQRGLGWPSPTLESVPNTTLAPLDVQVCPLLPVTCRVPVRFCGRQYWVE